MESRHGSRLSLAAIAVASAFTASPLHARDETIAISGAQAPGLDPGVLFSTGFGLPVLNDAGQTAFSARLHGAGVTELNDQVLYGGLGVLAREGGAVPGVSGVNYAGFGGYNINAAGQTAFFGFLSGSSVVAGTSDTGILRDGTLILQRGAGVPFVTDARYDFFGVPALNDSGRVAVRTTWTGGGVTFANNTAVQRESQIIARTGNFAPGLPFSTTLSGLDTPQIDNAGNLFYRATLAHVSGIVDSGNDQVIYRNSTPLVIEGNAVQNLSGVQYGSMGSPDVNRAGQVAFFSNLVGSGVTSANREAIFRDQFVIARSGGNPAGVPFGSGAVYSGFTGPQINNAGQVAFTAFVSGPGIDFTNGGVMIVRDSTLIARSGVQVPGNPSGTVFSDVFSPALGDGGQVAFFGFLTGAGIDFTNNAGLWMGDGTELVQVVRHGDLRGGKTVNGLNAVTGAQINSFGQVAYRALFAEGGEGLFLFTPEVRWRNSFGSNWDFAGNWTLGLNPAGVHDVRIDPSSAMTVFGPSANREVRSLQVGGGTGTATLSLQGGGITALSGPVQVMANGVLTGEGTVAGGVLNRGTVQAQNVGVQGGLTNEGMITGDGRVNADVTNASGGQIRPKAGESLVIGGNVANAAGGRIDVIDANLEVTGAAGNAGQLVARNAQLRFGSLANSAQVALSFGVSDVFGSIANAPGGSIVVSNGASASFYDEVTNNGILRVSAGGSANFFGLVSGSGIGGGGEVRFEGGFSPGSSPELVTIEPESWHGVDSPITMELGGHAPGTEHDKMIFQRLVHLEGGALDVIWLDPYRGSVGIFDLFDWNGGVVGAFGAINLPTLTAGLLWDIDNLYTSGDIGITAAIPEPETWALMLAGLGLLGFAARRRRIG